jgi:D-3-phosphoglycerate dehydrogenase
VVGYDPSLHASDGNWPRWGIQPLGLRELFESCDAVCVQMAYFSRYRGLLGERALAFAKPGQVLVSVSPLELFDEDVLAQALTGGQLTAAWMDNIGPSALEPGQPLHGVRGLLATPRLAAYTREARVRSAWGVAKQVDEVLRTAPQAPRPGTRRQAAAAESAQRAAGVNGHMPTPGNGHGHGHVNGNGNGNGNGHAPLPSHLQGTGGQAPDPAPEPGAGRRVRPDASAGLAA